MKNFRRSLVACAFAATALALPSTVLAESSASPSSAAVTELSAFQKAIRAQYDLKEKAWAKGDYETIISEFYAPDAFTTGEGEPKMMRGREAFRELYKTYVADVKKVRVESVFTRVSGNQGWDWTNFYHEPKSDKTKDYPPSPVRILFLWEKIGGRWVCTGDVILLGKFEPAGAKK